MPPRYLVAVIVAFWVGATTWLVCREIVPRLLVGDAPPFAIDLTNEVAEEAIYWRVSQKSNDDPRGVTVGKANSRVRRLADRNFQLACEINLHKNVSGLMGSLRTIITSYRVTFDGKLVSMSAVMVTRGSEIVPEIEASLEAVVEDGMLKPKARLFNSTPIDVPPVPMKSAGTVLNPMHLVSRINGLRKGQTWQIELLDPPSMAPGLSFKDLTVPALLAEVSETQLAWPVEEQEACLRIDYAPPGGKVIASTWVRRRDGLVLQQHANLHGTDLTFTRETR